MSVLFRFNGQAAYEVDTGRRKKIRVVFGMIDANKDLDGLVLVFFGRRR